MKTPKFIQAIFSSRQTATARFDIQAMSCAGCVARVEKAVATLPGISSVRVDFDSGQATIAYQPTKVSEEQIREQIVAAGYVATAVSLI